jgi:DNA sulfur modification protein DndD
MRITNIDIKNYRQYQDLSFKFPYTMDNDIHIIVAQNGVGKTNLLNAITWCLYGTEPHLSDGDKDIGLPKLNLRTVQESKEAGKESENVEVKIRAQDGDTYITYCRSLPYRISSEAPFEETAKEKFMVTVSSTSGDPKIIEDKEETKQFIDRYMPEKIREYFYFDGEQLNTYFIGNRKGKVREAIFSISQVDIVNRIYTNIGKIINEKQKEAAAKAPDIKRITDEIDEINEQEQSTKRNISDLEEQIAKSERIIQENTEFLQGEENPYDLEDEYQEWQKEKAKLEAEKKQSLGVNVSIRKRDESSNDSKKNTRNNRTKGRSESLATSD